MDTQPTVGLVDLDALGDVLAKAGCNVVSAGTPYIYTQLRDMVDQGKRVDAIIVADLPGQGGRNAWVDKMANSPAAPVVVVRISGGTGQIFRGPVVEVTPPLTIEELASAAHLELPNPAGVAGVRLIEDGSVVIDENEQALAPGSSPWGTTLDAGPAAPTDARPRSTTPEVSPWSAPPPATGTRPASSPEPPAVPSGPQVSPWSAPPPATGTRPASSPEPPTVPTGTATATAPRSWQAHTGHGQEPPAPEPYPSRDAPVADQRRVAPVADPVDALDRSTGRHFAGQARPGGSPTLPVRTSKAPVVYVVGAKGGVGKTTFALHLAQLAATAGRRVVLVDANRGQGDIRHYLRLNHDNDSLPAIRDVAAGGDPLAVITSPERLAAARSTELEPPPFAVVLAPRDARDADPRVVTADVYETTIDAARRLAASAGDGLVVVDTQTLDNDEQDGLPKLIISSLADDAWGLVVSDMSVASVNNTYFRLRAFQQAGVRPGRILLALNKVFPEIQPSDSTALEDLFKAYATFIGFGMSAPAIPVAMNVGKLVPDHPAVTDLLKNALWRITSDKAFNPLERDAGGGALESLRARLTRRRR